MNSRITFLQEECDAHFTKQQMHDYRCMMHHFPFWRFRRITLPIKVKPVLIKKEKRRTISCHPLFIYF